MSQSDPLREFYSESKLSKPGLDAEQNQFSKTGGLGIGDLRK